MSDDGQRTQLKRIRKRLVSAVIRKFGSSFGDFDIASG
jgi:hypothetical protein